MNHEDAAALLHDFHYGQIDGARRHEIEEHLDGCEECRALSRTYRVLHATLNHDQRAKDHPSSEEIVAYAVDRSGLDPGAALRVADHVKSCTVCSDAVEKTRQVHASVLARPGTGRPRRWSLQRSGVRVALAAALAGLALLIIADAYLRFGSLREAQAQLQARAARVDELTSSLDQARDELGRVESWGGAVDLTVLSSALRDETAAPVIRLREDQPHAPLVVELDLAAFELDIDAFGFEIHRAHGGPIWSVDLSADRVRESVESLGVVSFLVPAAELPPGDYKLRVVARGDPAAAPVLAVSFEVSLDG